MDVGALKPRSCVPFIIVFLFMGLFDTVGTLVGVSEQAGLLEDGRLPRANRALLVGRDGHHGGRVPGHEHDHLLHRERAGGGRRAGGRG